MENKNRILINVSLYIKGDQLNLEQVGDVMGVPATRMCVKGGKWNPRQKYPANTGYWSYRAPTNSELLCDHLRDVMEILQSVSIPLNEIDGVEEAYVDVFIGCDDDINAQTLTFFLQREWIDLLSRLGISFQFTLM